MPRSAASKSANSQPSWPVIALSICAILLALRLMTLSASPLELGPDEAQYWRWSKSLDWGYFSKPPLIAWAIALTTRFLGDVEWAVRLSAPLAHGVAAFFIGRAAGKLGGEKASGPAALIYLSAPGVAVSSFIVSTDAFLLAAAAMALSACLALRRHNSTPAHISLGVALGLGLLAKYAMIYTFLGILIACIFDRDLRRAFFNWRALISIGLAAALIAPNLYWNATHSFATFHHTAANADLKIIKFDPKELGDFIAGQLGVFGPLAFVLLPFALLRGEPKSQPNASTLDDAAAAFPKALLSLLILLPLTIVAIEALINRANANWAAIAYPAAAVLVTLWCLRTKRPRVLFATIAINVVLSALVIVGTAAPHLADQIGASNSIKRTRGWDDITRSIAQAAAAGPHDEDLRFQAVVFDNRLIFHETDYYGRTRFLPPLRMWRSSAAPLNHAQASAPLSPGSGPFLFVLSTPANLDIVANDFARFEPAGGATVFLGENKKGKIKRHVDFYIAEGYAPKPRDADYERQWSSASGAKGE